MGLPEQIYQVELNRDGLDAPWGFRLKGGRDVEGGTPLEVIKVRGRVSVVIKAPEKL